MDLGTISEIHLAVTLPGNESLAAWVVSFYLLVVMSLFPCVLFVRQNSTLEAFATAEVNEAHVMYAAVHQAPAV